MQREYLALRQKLLKHRKTVIELRSEKFEEFIKELAKVFGDKATIILIGSHAKKIARTYSDFDLLIVYRDLREEDIYDRVRQLKSSDLPIDVLPVNVRDFNPNDKILAEMLKERKILHDGIHLFS